jgi:hypothetical protein
LQELNRILRPGGLLFVCENNPFNPLMMRAMRNNPFDDGTEVVHPGDLRQKVRAAGFHFNSTAYYIFFPRWLKFLRFGEGYLRWLPLGAQYYTLATK